MTIRLKKVQVHNLKSVNLNLDPYQLIVFSGVSGSGKSSLAFDTIYVEGQRRYVESLSNFARRYMGNLPAPEAELIEGLSPTISIEQKTISKNPRSTVGTITGIYDYLRVIYARLATPYCPVSGDPVTPISSKEILKVIFAKAEHTRMIVLSPSIKNQKGHLQDYFDEMRKKGFMRLRVDGEIIDLADPIELDPNQTHDADLVIDRLSITEENHGRIREALEMALELSEGMVILLFPDEKDELFFSQLAYSKKSGLSYPPLEPQDFSFNHPDGMCPECEGLGICQDYDLELIIDPNKSIAEDCCLIASSVTTVKYGNIYRNLSIEYNFDLNTPWKDLPKSAQRIFLYGSKKRYHKMRFIHPETGKTWIDYVVWNGVLGEAKKRFSEAKSESYRKKMQALMTETICPSCQGSRIKPYPSAARLGNLSIYELTSLPIKEAAEFFQSLKLNEYQEQIGAELIYETKRKIQFLLDVGLHYLSLSRLSPSLSGGEAQRVRLASQIGSGLVGATYVLDEPSIGLHPRDNTKLIQTLIKLRDQGNTVIVVEHDEETMQAADTIVDVGPEAGFLGGEILAVGTLEKIKKEKRSITGAYLRGDLTIPIPAKPKKRDKNNQLTIKNASHHNLKNITLDIPLGLFVSIAGVSGSGKSSLISDTLYPFLANTLNRAELKVGPVESINGYSSLDKVISIDQSPIGRTPRSNPATYTKLWDDIREIFTQLPESQAYGYKAGRFSFNVAEGSCPTCGGMGQLKIDMDFLADAYELCPTCLGKRFDDKTLSIYFKGKNIHDILTMTIEEALHFFDAIPNLKKKLETLHEVGLGYLELGQASTTLSGGEAQRVKLAKELMRPSSGKTLYLLDEPTTGLHFHDIAKLIRILRALVEQGNSVLVIEHNLDFVRATDWVIELGPEGGKEGGYLIAEETPSKLSTKQTPTGKALKTHSQIKKTTAQKQKASNAIQIRGANQNNLKNISLEIPRNAMSVCTGLSGSGKSSLAFDTIYAEGQRRYIDSLSAYARQFVKQMPKPKVEEISGLSPAISIEQKHHAGNPRSTVGTITEIYDYLRLLYSHLGIPHCPETNDPLIEMTPQKILDTLLELPEGEKIHFLAQIDGDLSKKKDELIKKGFLRIRLNGSYYELDEEFPYESKRKNQQFLVIDRLAVRKGAEKRILDAIEQTLRETDKPFVVATKDQDLLFHLSFVNPKTNQTYPKITPHTFSFNRDEGMCTTCEGLGYEYRAQILENSDIMRLSPITLIDRLWKELGNYECFDLFEDMLDKWEIDPDLPLSKQPSKALELLLHGGIEFEKKPYRFIWKGLYEVLAIAAKAGKKDIKQQLLPYMSLSPCTSCHGKRLNPLALHVTIEELSIADFCNLPIQQAFEMIEKLKAPVILEETMRQLKNRLQFLCDIGLHYLSLGRMAPTLSGGETQRIHLAKQLGSGLTGCLYVLDEPTVGLHPHNNTLLNQALKKLRSLNNTLLLVEHDPLTVKEADYLIEFGPGAGIHGGELIAQGKPKEILENPKSLTGQYLSGKRCIPLPNARRESDRFFSIQNAKVHNLKNISVDIPLKSLVGISGVSGSGKSSLMHYVLKPALKQHLALKTSTGTITRKEGVVTGLEQFDKAIFLDQNPIGTTNRADICTYSELLAPLRTFYSELSEAKMRGLKPKHFSYNHLKGMCRTCWGLGYKRIKLQFMPPAIVECPTCHGEKLNNLSLQVAYKGKNLGKLLKLNIEEAREFLPPHAKIVKILDTLISVGLGYLSLGQPIATLSGGEAQRLRLAKELAKRSTGKTIYLFDEPTIGLHAEDIKRLLGIFQTLVDKGNTVLLIEHNLDVLKCCDVLLEIGPDAGEKGGKIIDFGTPEKIAANPSSKTGPYLKPLLEKQEHALV